MQHTTDTINYDPKGKSLLELSSDLAEYGERVDQFDILLSHIQYRRAQLATIKQEIIYEMSKRPGADGLLDTLIKPTDPA